MSNKSEIEWTEATWNPIVGCNIVSPGCTNCYAMRLARRLEESGQPKYTGTTTISGGRPKWNGKIKLDDSLLELPYKWKKGRMIFVNSMSDMFHETVPLEFINKIFLTMKETPQHTYQILTKRSKKLEECAEELEWPTNVWMGVSVENIDYLYRVDSLRHTNAFVKFISFEPLLQHLGRINLVGIDWVIVGGESGPDARPMNIEWVRAIRDQCESGNIAFYFKQWGGENKKLTGKKLDGLIWEQYPTKVSSKLPLFDEISP